MKRFIVLSAILVFSFSFTSVHAQQSYKAGLGLRGGYPSGVTGKLFLGSKHAVEGVLSFGWGGIGVTGLYQIHAPISDVQGLSWYYGFGGHLATGAVSKGNPYSRDESANAFIGADGVLGAEYVFKEIPVSLSLDIVPFISILPSVYPGVSSGLSVRYTFK